MSIGTEFAGDIAALIFNGTNIANIADNATSSPNTLLWVSLHTSSPGTGNQSTNESTDPSYARKSVARSSGGFTVTGGVINPTGVITFNEESGSPITYTHAAIGIASSGSNKILVHGALGTPIIGGLGKIPQLKTTTAITIS